jgi:hypothetical protein
MVALIGEPCANLEAARAEALQSFRDGTHIPSHRPRRLAPTVHRNGWSSGGIAPRSWIIEFRKILFMIRYRICPAPEHSAALNRLSDTYSLS